MRPSGSTKRFPPCRSPWKMPWIMAPSMKPIMPVRTTASVSTPASRMPATSSNLKPSSRSITSTRGVTSSGWGRGITYVALAQLGERLRHVEHVLRLDAEVELLGDRLGEQLDEGRRVGQRRDRDPTDRERREPRHDPEVLVDELPDRRALHLHDDVLARAQRRAVHLRDRRRGEGLGVEPREHLLRAAAEVLLHHPADHRERLRRHLVAAPLELRDELLGEDPLAGADDLPELDVGGSEALGGEAQPAGEDGGGLGGATAASTEVPAGERAAQQRGGAEHPHPRGHPGRLG